MEHGARTYRTTTNISEDTLMIIYEMDEGEGFFEYLMRSILEGNAE
jgi:hypothetical protein